MKRPLLPALLGLCLGIWTSLYFEISLKTNFCLSIFFILLFLLSSEKKKVIFIFASMFFLFFFAGNYSSHFNQKFFLESSNLSSYVNNPKIYLIARVEQRPEGVAAGPFRVLLSARAIKNEAGVNSAQGKLWLSIQNGEPTIEEGDIVQVVTHLNTINSFKNFGLFNYQEKQKQQGLVVQAWVEHAGFVVKIGEEKNSFLKLKNKILQHLKQELKNVSELQIREWIEALLLGERKITQETEELFRRTGTSHLIVVSGLHMTMISAFFYTLFRLCFSFFPRLLLYVSVKKLSLIISLVPLIFYSYLVGFSSSVLRSLLSFSALALLLLWRKNSDSLSVLINAAFWILIFYPLQLFELSFQLSFLAIFFMITVPVSFPSRIAVVMSIFLSCLIVQIGLLPLLAHSFHQVSLISPLVNVLLVPYYTLILMPLGISWMLLTLCGLPSLFLLKTLVFFSDFSLQALSFFASFSWASLNVFGFNFFQTCGAYLLFLFLLFHFSLPLSKNYRKIIVLLFAVNLFLWLQPYYVRHYSDKVKIHFLDVGQGDAMLLELPHAKTFLVDGGGLVGSATDVGERVLLPYLLQNQFHQIDVAIISHPHPDHYLGILSLLKQYPIKEIWFNGESSSSESFQELLSELVKLKIPLKKISAGDIPWNENGVKIETLFPDQLNTLQKINNSEVNNRSLVLKLTAQEFSLLMTGDIEEESEGELVKEDLQLRLKSTILKVPHHGSNSSSTEEFLTQVQPQLALMGLGKNNRFNFPRPQILERYAAHKIEVLRTDIDGEIILEWKSPQLTWKSHSQKSGFLKLTSPSFELSNREGLCK